MKYFLNNDTEVDIKSNNDVYQITLSGISHTGKIISRSENEAIIQINNEFHTVSFNEGKDDLLTLRLNGKTETILVENEIHKRLHDSLRESQSQSGRIEIKSQMPGLIRKLHVEVESEVTEGDPLVVLEAMKMENVIKSPKAGKIESIHISEGDTIDKGELILVIS